MNEILEESRDFWASVAKRNNWYTEPFHVQVWLNPDGTLNDSVSFSGLQQDIIIQLETWEDEEE